MKAVAAGLIIAEFKANKTIPDIKKNPLLEKDKRQRPIIIKIREQIIIFFLPTMSDNFPK